MTAKVLLIGYGIIALILLGLATRARIIPGTSTGDPSQVLTMLSASRMANASGHSIADTPAWEQDFTAMPAGALPSGTWRYELDPAVPGYNDEAEAYTDRPANVRIEKGTGLVITARQEVYRYPNDPSGKSYQYTSGRIDTRDSFNFIYGTIVASMRLPKGSGTWPAFWLLSANQPYTSLISESVATDNDPRFYLKDGELDIMESYGSNLGVIEGTAHTYHASQDAAANVPDYATTFHDYGITVLPSSVTWTIDGEPYFTLHKSSNNPDDWPFGGSNKLYPILNLALGGPDSGPIDNSQGPWTLAVHNVRYYPYR